MGIVRFALRFPHTFYVLAALILFLGIAAIRSMPTDIFPEIRIPLVTVICQYTGLTTPQFGQPERAAALRFRHLSRSSAIGACPGRHATDAGGWQISSDHGRYRSGQAAVPGADAARHRECRQYAEPDASVRDGEDWRDSI